MATIDQLAKARRLHDQDVPIADIAREMGVAYNTVHRWVDPEFAEQQREIVRQYKDENREAVRAAGRDHNRKHRGQCLTCGDLMGIGVRHDGTCSGCRSAEVHERRMRVVALWEGGATWQQIADDLGWTLGHLAVEMGRMRKVGYDLPYRYAVQNGRGVAA